MPESEIGEHHGHDGIGSPGIEAPMEITDLYGLGRRQAGTPLPHRRCQKVHDRLGDAIEHQADANARCEQH